MTHANTGKDARNRLFATRRVDRCTAIAKRA